MALLISVLGGVILQYQEDGTTPATKLYGAANDKRIQVNNLNDIIINLRKIKSGNVMIDDVSLAFAASKAGMATDPHVWLKLDALILQIGKEIQRIERTGLVLMTGHESPPRQIKGIDGNEKEYRGGLALAGKMGEYLGSMMKVMARVDTDDYKQYPNWKYCLNIGDVNWQGRDRDAVLTNTAPLYLPGILRYSGYDIPEPTGFSDITEEVATKFCNKQQRGYRKVVSERLIEKYGQHTARMLIGEIVSLNWHINNSKSSDMLAF
tara:strand:+ start:10268 stop:11062 length:795 start_codon:yes stop_codon:yes gene_type:complete